MRPPWLSRGPNLRHALTVLAAAAGSLTFVLFVAAVAVAIAATLGTNGSASTWLLWGNVGQTFESVSAAFSGLAFIALVVTFRIQYKELRLQRMELEMQRKLMEESRTELHLAAEAELRKLHVQLIAMAIQDPALAAVWPDLGFSASPERNRQHLYSNLIVWHYWLARRIGGYSEEQVRSQLRYLFTSPLVREYWAAADFARAGISDEEDCDEWRFAQLVDEVYRSSVDPAPDPTDPRDPYPAPRDPLDPEKDKAP
jgi:hypothetical protein